VTLTNSFLRGFATPCGPTPLAAPAQAPLRSRPPTPTTPATTSPPRAGASLRATSRTSATRASPKSRTATTACCRARCWSTPATRPPARASTWTETPSSPTATWTAPRGATSARTSSPDRFPAPVAASPPPAVTSPRRTVPRRRPRAHPRVSAARTPAHTHEQRALPAAGTDLDTDENQRTSIALAFNRAQTRIAAAQTTGTDDLREHCRGRSRLLQPQRQTGVR
jgi:hypothetical protein